MSFARKKFRNKNSHAESFSNENEGDYYGKEIEIFFEMAGTGHVAIDHVLADFAL